MRFIIVAAAIGLIVFWLFRAARGTGSRPDLPKEGPKADRVRDRSGTVQDMVACAHCGLHLPKTESISGRSAVFCSAEHKRLAES